jgi:hypothetical protein
MNPRSWRTLADGGTEGVVAAVDFPQTGRPEAGFADLAGNLTGNGLVVQTVPPPLAPDPEVPAAAYIGPWARDLREDGREVRAVLGFCVGAVYAAALAEEISRWQPARPEVILFDPEPAGARSVHEAFTDVLEELAPILGAAGTVAAAKEADTLLRTRRDDPAACAVALLDLYREVGHGALRSIGLDDARIDEMTTLFGAYLAYLSTAGTLDPLPGWRGATALGSTTPDRGLNALTAGIDGPASFARELRFDVDHRDLLRDSDVARAVEDLLRAWRPEERAWTP